MAATKTTKQTASKGKAKVASKAKPAAKDAASAAGADGSPGALAKEALSQWGTAIRLGVAALAAGKATGDATEKLSSAAGEKDDSGPGIVERIKPDGPGIRGKAADWALSKLGPAGKVGSKLGLGSKLAGGGSSDDSEAEEEGDGDAVESEVVVSIPIQESVTVAVPAGLAYRLATRFEDFPQFLDHVNAVEVASKTEFAFDARLHGSSTTGVIDVFDRREDERIDWRSVEGPEHSGTVSFHELAPRLTHIELSIDMEPQGLVQRMSRAVRLSNHVVRAEMQRFKAYAELFEDDGDADFEQPEDEAEASEGDEDAAAEDDSEDELEDEEEFVAEGDEDLEDDEEVAAEDEELEDDEEVESAPAS